MSEARVRKIHFTSGLVLTVFIGAHLLNHGVSLAGARRHIELMDALRGIYRTPIIEFLLLAAVIVQIYSGIRLFALKRKAANSGFEKLHIYSGLYLAFFLVIHVSAVLVGRYFLRLDTNFYFGAAGLNTFPYSLFFVPYYVLAVVSFFGHIASIHYEKCTRSVFGLSPTHQSVIVLSFGVIISMVILYGFTDGFRGRPIPDAYQILVGK
jgi:hypothetical protein